MVPSKKKLGLESLDTRLLNCHFQKSTVTVRRRPSVENFVTFGRASPLIPSGGLQYQIDVVGIFFGGEPSIFVTGFSAETAWSAGSIKF